MPPFQLQEILFWNAGADIASHVVTGRQSLEFSRGNICTGSKQVTGFSFHLGIHTEATRVCFGLTTPIDFELDEREEKHDNSEQTNPELRINAEWYQPFA